MTISDKSQQTDLFGTELDQTLLPEGFHAKTCQQQESRQALTVSEVDYGPSLPVLLASYNRDTQSWKTSQASLVATGDDGLDEFLETWPRSGMTRNGIAYQLPTLAYRTSGTEFGFWPTPAAVDYKGSRTPESLALVGRQERNSLRDFLRSQYQALYPPIVTVESMMGFPIGHTDLKP